MFVARRVVRDRRRNGSWYELWGAKRYIGEPAEDAHNYRALRDYAIKTGQYAPKTGEVRRVIAKTRTTGANR